MPIQEHEIRPLDLRAASDHEYACFNAFENTLRAEVLPDDPPMPCVEETEVCRARPEFVKEAAWAAWDPSGKRIVAFAAVDAEYTRDNQHLAEFVIEVLPEYRRQGLGRELLSRVPPFARQHDRRLLIASSTDRVPASGAFLARIGASKGLDAGLNELCLADLDTSLIANWMSRSAQLSPEFYLEFSEGPCPAERLVGLTTLVRQLITDSPHDTLELEDSQLSSEIWRQYEAWGLVGGRRRWMLRAIHRPDDRVVGMTDITWSVHRPSIIWQGGTGVWPDYRNRGLGRWLKAAMLTKILHDLPEARLIRTGNADSNAAMLKINWELGFKPLLSRPAWQVETQTIEKYLAGSLQAA